MEVDEEKIAGEELSRKFNICMSDWKCVQEELEEENERLRVIILKKDEAEKLRRDMVR